ALQRSAATFGTAGYTRAQHSVATLQAETLIELGRGAEGWQVRIAATRNLQALTPTQMLHNALIDGARSAELDGLRFAHESFLIEAGLFADERGHAISQAEVALRWGDVAVDRGRPGEALARYAQAEAIASRVGAEKIRERLLANARFGRFMLEPPGVAELSMLDRTLDFYEENGPRWRMTDLLRLSAMALSATGETSRARQRFQRASADLIHQGTIISDSRSTERFWASVQHLFDDFIAFEMGDGRVEAALEVLARARSTAFASPPVASPGFSARIRDPTLVFTVVDEQAYWWRVDAAGVDGGAFTSVGLVDRVDTLVARLRAGSFPRRLATDLFEELLAPRLEETDVTIAIMADGPLGNLPFGALVDPSTAKPFATTHSYYLITGLGRSDAVDTPEATRSVVAVGDPGSAAVSVGWPPRLPESRREASSIADLYNRATLLLGDRATATGVSSAIRNADVFHFAGHTESIGPETQGVLYLADDVTGVAPIPATTLLGSGNAGALRIVVLSACESLQPSTGRVTGILGPARAFLDAGVSTVVGTLWKARDGVLASVMTDLHSGIRAGDSPSEALRDAIASYLADPTSPCCEWASIQVVRRSH
ncbi:MAG: CHAT domain-containing protein, partial [Gemmatimonadetes bacterium]|nr:CHAT domain-containing protein [Gemmatimonadota bacterium]